ncbi:MAG: phosphomannomutase/phosphoglucomutase [Deltaproteobacteria bacterium]|nr:phosphomannomutase/phosphoglucomutase [Deltaproteobacteria bacterium]
MSFQKKIFREYDIRGIYGDDYTADFAGILAHAVADYFRDHMKPGKGRTSYRFAVGHDVRPSGEHLAPRFIDALVAEGFEVIDIGVVATPLVYFSTFHLDVDGAVSITGSHNPSEYNGFKICFGNSTLHGTQIQELLRLCESFKARPPAPAGRKGSVTKTDVADAYINDLKGRVKIERKIKVVVDAGNATACVVAPKLLTALGCEVIPLFCDIDGTFPNHHPDPTVVENLVDLQKAVAKHKADLGIAYDGDSDRIGAVDENGRPIFGDELMVLFAREILSRKPGSTIISEVKSSHRLYQDIAKHGGRPIMWKTGHSLIKAKMKEEKAELAGEMSGHMFFADRYYGYDDAIYASIRLLEILSRTKNTLSSLLADLPLSVNTPEIRVDCADEIKFEVVRRVRDDLGKRFKTNDVDGVRIETDVAWGLLRASNTQPVVVMRFEANTEKQLAEIRKIVEDAFETATKAVQAASR